MNKGRTKRTALNTIFLNNIKISRLITLTTFSFGRWFGKRKMDSILLKRHFRIKQTFKYLYLYCPINLTNIIKRNQQHGKRSRDEEKGSKKGGKIFKTKLKHMVNRY